MKEKIIVITSYPPKESLYGKKVGGLASFAKNTIQSIGDKFEFIILAEILDKKDEYTEGNNLVKRIWNRGKLSLYFKLLKELWKYRKESNHIFLEFEFSIFGGMYVTGFMPLFLFASKLFGYKTTIVIHQVVEDIRKLAKHLGLKEKTFRLNILNFLLKKFFKMLCSASNKLIVLDQIHKENLQKITKSRRDIHVIPHGVDQKEVVIREIDEVKNIMYFGFMTWYKGADWLVKNFDKYCKDNPDKSKNLKLYMVGGQSPTQKDNPNYGEFYNELEDYAQSNDQIELTGFIDEKEFDKYFLMADLVVLPYRVLMSSSGPLSLAFTYKKPFLMSNKLSQYMITNDFVKGLNYLQLQAEDVTFKLEDNERLFDHIRKLDKVSITKLVALSTYIKDARSWESLGKEYVNVLMD
jgi:glycosyltransferase involved in cell wall biosynthesis